MEGLNSHLTNRYKRIERRVLFLRQRIVENTKASGEYSHDRRELSALEWAKRIILKYYQEHPMEDDNIKPCEECLNGINPRDGSTCSFCLGNGEVQIPPRIRKPKYDSV